LVQKVKVDSPKGNIKLIALILAIGIFGMLFISMLGWFAVIPFLWVGILTIAIIVLEIVLMIKLLANPSWK